MAKLLYIESSPRKDRSASIAVSKAFLEERNHTQVIQLRFLISGQMI